MTGDKDAAARDVPLHQGTPQTTRGGKVEVAPSATGESPEEGTTPANQMPGTQRPQKRQPTRPKKPGTVRELIEFAYAEGGKKLQLVQKDLVRIKVYEGDAISSENQLVRTLAGGDPLLQVVPRLLELVPLAADAQLGPLRHRILDISLISMSNHPVFADHALGLGSRGLNSSIDVDELTAATVRRSAKATTAAQLKLPETEFKEGMRKRLSDNAVTAFVLFRVLRDRWEFDRFLSTMAEHVWRPEMAARTSATKQAVALASTRETEPIHILLQHLQGVRRAADQRERDLGASLNQARRQLAEATARADALAAQLRDMSAAQDELQKQFGVLQADLRAAQSKNVVDQSHHVDDYETLRTQTLRRLTSQAGLLSDGLHALRNGSHGVAEEFVDRALTAIEAEVGRLRELGGGER